MRAAPDRARAELLSAVQSPRTPARCQGERSGGGARALPAERPREQRCEPDLCEAIELVVACRAVRPDADGDARLP